MAGEVYEWYGFRAEDRSDVAREAATLGTCPFVPGPCTKETHTCSLRFNLAETVIVCPKRLYYDGHHVVRQIAAQTFGPLYVNLGPDGLPTIVPGDEVKATAEATGNTQVGLFGQGWAKEIRLPAGVEGGARYSVDYTAVAVTPDGELVGFCPIEVQTADISGSYQPSLRALQDGRRLEPSPKLGMNWENVSKRILPQLITKGLTLQGERLCSHGIFFVSPEATFQRIMTRLGGMARYRQIPQQPGSITFIRFEHESTDLTDGSPVPLRRCADFTISTSDMSLGFITPQNLAGAGAYEATIIRNL